MPDPKSVPAGQKNESEKGEPLKLEAETLKDAQVKTLTHDEFLSANAEAVAIFAHLEQQKNTNVVKKAKTVADVQRNEPEVVMSGDEVKLTSKGEPMMSKRAVTVLFTDGTKERFREKDALYKKALEFNRNASVMMVGRLIPSAETRAGEYGDYGVTVEKVVWDDAFVIFDASKYAPVGVGA